MSEKITKSEVIGTLTLNDNKHDLVSEKITRREVIKRAAYITPVILTLIAVPAFANGGSEIPDS